MLLAWLFLLSGCSTTETRKQERPEAFSQLNKEQQAAVMRGRIVEGMSEDAVYIALGNPLRKTMGHLDGKDTVSWIYGRLETYNYPAYHYANRRLNDGTVVVTPEYFPQTDAYVRDSFVVYFLNGKVSGWQQL